MQAINEVLNHLVATNMADSHSSEICPYCGHEVPAIEIDVLGRKRWVQPICRCEQEAKKAEWQQMENYQRAREVRELFSISNMGEKYLHASFANFEHRPGSEDALKIAKYYATHFDEFGLESIMLWGEPGNGKTHLAAAIHHHLVSQGKVVVFMSMPELLGKIRATFHKNNREREQHILRALNGCDLLIIDDLGAEKTTDWVLETVFTIVDARYRSGLPILTTSNLSPQALPAQIGKRVCDRLVEMSQPIENKATSYRREIAKGRLSKFHAILKP